MADDQLLPRSVAFDPAVAAFEDLAARTGDIDLKSLLIYAIDTVDASALVFLAEQFDVEGFGGWALTETEQDRRELIKRAIELHRYKGTPYAIKEALRSVGFGSVRIDEGISAYMNGFFSMDGEIDMGHLGWADFRVVIDLAEYPGEVVGASQTLLKALIDVYKPARSHLTDIKFTQSFFDQVTPAEAAWSATVQFPALEETGAPNDDALFVDVDLGTDSDTIPQNPALMRGGITMGGIMMMDGNSPLIAMTDGPCEFTLTRVSTGVKEPIAFL